MIYTVDHRGPKGWQEILETEDRQAALEQLETFGPREEWRLECTLPNAEDDVVVELHRQIYHSRTVPGPMAAAMLAAAEAA